MIELKKGKMGSTDVFFAMMVIQKKYFEVYN